MTKPIDAKQLMKLLTPIATLTGYASSVESGANTTRWSESLLKHGKEAEVALDKLMDIFLGMMDAESAKVPSADSWNPDAVLARLPTEGNRTKYQELEACYAMLFKQFNQMGDMLREERAKAPPVPAVSQVEINNLLHRMNLDRPDIKELPEGHTIAVNITTHRHAADLIKRLAAGCYVPAAHEGLREAIIAIDRYGRHESGCQYLGSFPRLKCTCGFDGALDILDAMLPGQPEVDWSKCDCPPIAFADGPHRHHLHNDCKGYAGGNTERHISEPSGFVVDAPHKLGNALNALPPAPIKDTWTCPDCCVNPCGCKIMGEYGHRPEDCATHPAGNSAPATQAYQQVRGALEALYRHSHGIWKRRGGEDKYEPDIYEKCRKALALLPALRPVERGEVSVVAKIKRASFLPEQRDIEAKELVIYSSQAIGFVEDAARTTEPVSSPVSLEKCARAAAMAHGIVPNKGNMEYWKPQAKAVLDSAKQQGALFDYVD